MSRTRSTGGDSVSAEAARPMSFPMRVLSYTLSGMLLALTMALILESAVPLHLVPAWLISINVFTLIFYWIDKINAVWVGDSESRKAKNMRIPEMALLLLALVGGTPGAALAIIVLGHKGSKGGFLALFAMVVVVQILLIYMYWEQLPWP